MGVNRVVFLYKFYISIYLLELAIFIIPSERDEVDYYDHGFKFTYRTIRRNKQYHGTV